MGEKLAIVAALQPHLHAALVLMLIGRPVPAKAKAPKYPRRTFGRGQAAAQPGYRYISNTTVARFSLQACSTGSGSLTVRRGPQRRLPQ